MFWRREGASHHTHHLKVILETMKEQRRPRRTIREGRGTKERGREGAKSSQQPRPRRRKKLNRAAAAEKRAARSLPKIWQKSPTEAGGRRRGRGEGTGRIIVAAARRGGGSNIQEEAVSLPSPLLLPLSIHPSLSLSFCPRAGDREITAQLDTNVTPAAKRKEPLCRRKLPNVARKFAMLCAKHSKAPYQKLRPLDRARIGIRSRGPLCVDSDEINWCYCDDRGRRRTGWRRQKMDAPRLSGCERALVRGNQGDRAQRAAHATKHAQPEFEVWAIISG